MMNLGRLQGFEGRITAQGRLLLQDTLLVHDSTSDEQKPQKKSVSSSADKQAAKYKERRVFLFQQIIIFSEMVGPANPKSKFTSPKYIFKCDMKVNKLKLEKDDAQLTFSLLDKTPDITPRKIVCLCEDTAKYNNWITHLQNLLDMQNQFLRDLQNPQEAIKKIGDSSPAPPPCSGHKGGNHHHKEGGQHAGHSSHQQSHHQSLTSHLNDFLKSTFNFSSSSSSSSSGNNTSSAVGPSSPPHQANNSNNSHSNRSSTASTGTANTISPKQQQVKTTDLSSELAQQLTLNNTAAAPVVTNANSSSTSDSRKNSQSTAPPPPPPASTSSSNIPNFAKCISSYTAITEDEITVQKGDLVQIIVANMHNRFLVHREANEQQPAAEGWIPGFVIGSQISATVTTGPSSSS